MSIDPESHEFEAERLIGAEPDTLFDGFIELYEGGDRPDWILSSEMERHVGGKWVVELKPPHMESVTETRIITELDRPRRLAYSMTMPGVGSAEPVSTEVGLSFEAQGAQTLVKLDQRGFRTKQQAENFAWAWPQVLELLSGRTGG